MDCVSLWFEEDSDDFIPERVQRKLVRDKSDIMNLNDKTFVKNFRLNKSAVTYVMNRIECELKAAQRSTAIPPLLKLAASLKFLAQGGYQHQIGQDRHLGISQQSMSSCLSEVCRAIEKVLCPKHIVFESTEEKKREAKRYFYDKSGIPGVIGAVDGTHIQIITPSDNEHLYFNRKLKHSINAMAVSSTGRFGGACHDSHVWNLSSERQYLNEKFENGDRSTRILEPLQSGLYLKAFANGIECVLDDYLNNITELERRYLNNPSQSLMFIYQKLQEYEPLALYLAKLIRGIRIQKLHGCAIIQYLQQNSLHGDARIHKAIKVIQAAVNVVFLKQLTHWILYAKIVDSYGEFFIQCSENHCNSTLESERGTSAGSAKHTATSMSEAASNYTDIWRYEICYEFLPYYLSSSWAEKVLFIGQTVLIFKVDANKLKKNAQIWNKTENNLLAREQSLWNEKEHIYFAKIQALQNDPELNVSHYDRVVDEIKSYVTSRLSEIAVNQADLVQQLKLIKDFYLLGRGELFLEFIRQTYIINKDADNENKLRDFVKAFESAAHGVGVSEDLEQFSLCIPKFHFDSDESHEFGYLQLVHLQYKINWPLHLLFSPKVLERYNILFRFLLLIKKMQYELHMLWCQHTRESKVNAKQNIRIMHLRNELMFFVDNLQYYIQVDVLESQFSILLNTILNKADFEQIQRSHSIFQANILSLCFLLADEDASKVSILQSSSFHSTNPVYLFINEIFHICDDFCTLVDAQPMDENLNDKIDQLDERFGNLIQQLINQLVGLKTAPSSTPLSQLLLRLDFNHWFSIKKKRNGYD